MNHEFKKLKSMKRIPKSRKSGILTRPQFCKHPVQRKKIKKFHPTPIKVDATGEVLLGSAIAGPAGTIIGVGSATVRTSSHIAISVLKKIREKAEETREAEKESAKIQGGSHGW